MRLCPPGASTCSRSMAFTRVLLVQVRCAAIFQLTPNLRANMTSVDGEKWHSGCDVNVVAPRQHTPHGINFLGVTTLDLSPGELHIIIAIVFINYYSRYRGSFVWLLAAPSKTKRPTLA